jgi:hypothetical protein
MLYRGYEIEKFYSKEPVPKHIVREYYQGEKARIDRIIAYKEKHQENIENGFKQKSVNETLDEFFKEIEE